MSSCTTEPKPPSSGSSHGAGGGAGQTADLVFVAGKVRTLDPARPLAPALAVKAGRILAAGEEAEIKALIGPATKVIGLDGRTLIPGLVDSHMHLSGLGIRRSGVDLVGTKSIDEVRTRVAKAVREAKAGAWVRGRGWDQNDWEASNKRFPTAKDLDAIAPEHPVVLSRIDGHAIWVNTKAMEAAGVGPTTQAPSGGQIVMEKGRPGGVFVDNAMTLILSRVPPLTRSELMRAYELAQAECLEAGLTQVHDMGVTKDELEILRELDGRGELKLRVYAMLEGEAEDLEGLMGEGPIVAGDRARLTVRGVKLFIDGALGSRGAALFAPYSDDPKNSGLVLMAPAKFESRVALAKARGFQVATHAIGDRGNRLVLDVYERVFGAAAKEARPRVEHAQVLAIDDIPRFAKLGVIASMQPTHATSDMPWAEARVGPERIRGAYAWRAILASHGVIASGSDAPVEEISPIAGLYAAITRQDAAGSPEGGWRPEERMTPEEALRSFTAAAAFASFREGEAGVLAEGKVADMTVLDLDPVEAAPEKLLGAKVEMTVVGGEIVWAR